MVVHEMAMLQDIACAASKRELGLQDAEIMGRRDLILDLMQKLNDPRIAQFLNYDITSFIQDVERGIYDRVHTARHRERGMSGEPSAGATCPHLRTGGLVRSPSV